MDKDIASFEWEHGVMVLSNYSSHQVSIWGHVFPTAEHAYQWKKFHNPEIKEQILKSTSAHAAWSLAQTHKRNSENICPSFDKKRDMEEILRAKVQQHEDVHQALVETGSLTIKKFHPHDTYWSITQEHGGENIQGVLWMEIRDEII